jgi:hypothetical protein
LPRSRGRTSRSRDGLGQVSLDSAETELVADLLADAWEHKAPRRREPRLRSAPWENWRESPSS